MKPKDKAPERKKASLSRRMLVKSGLFPLDKANRYIIVEFKPDGIAAMHLIPDMPADQAINILRDLIK